MYLPFSQYRVFSVLFGLYLVRPSIIRISGPSVLLQRRLIWNSMGEWAARPAAAMAAISFCQLIVNFSAGICVCPRMPNGRRRRRRTNGLALSPLSLSVTCTTLDLGWDNFTQARQGDNTAYINGIHIGLVKKSKKGDHLTQLTTTFWWNETRG